MKGWAAGAALLLGACSGLQPSKVQGVEGRRHLDVPFFADDTDQCGPAALAAVLSFWGDAVGPADLKKEVYLADAKGSLSLDLLLAAKRRGFSARLYRGSVADLKSELDRGHPLIVYVNRGYDAFPIGHFMVVTGYDDARRGLLVHSALSRDRFVGTRAFERDWDKAQRSTLLILKDREASHAVP